MITHRFPFAQAAAAFDLLYHRPAEALGVLLVWD
jgi:threonine dehydrogenase-like Zn-dependent dehydrogenase